MIKTVLTLTETEGSCAHRGGWWGRVRTGTPPNTVTCSRRRCASEGKGAGFPSRGRSGLAPVDKAASEMTFEGEIE